MPQDKEIEHICLAIDNLLINKLDDPPLDENIYSPQYQALVTRINRMQLIFQQLNNFAKALSMGNFDASYPDRRNYLVVEKSVVND
jgi:hypothetical protein